MRLKRFTQILGVLALHLIQQCHASNIIISSATFQPTDSLINISVMLENNSASILNLAAFSFELQLTPVTPRRVEFVSASQPDSLNNVNYIFAGNSAAQVDTTTPWAVNSLIGGLNNDFTFTDTTNDTLNMSLAANQTKLLANIWLKPGTGSFTPQPGDVFTLTIVSAGTSLFDESLNPIGFTSNSGTLSVPVPEPSSMVLSLIAIGIGMAARSRTTKISEQETLRTDPETT